MSVERGSLLYQTGRHDLAEVEFRQALLDDPRDANAHALLGLCLAHREEFKEATTEAEEAIRLRPDWDFGYHTLATILRDRNRLKEAAAAVAEAIRLDPFDASHQGLLAVIRMGQRDWRAALAAADAGLQIDPENIVCINTRGMALTNLGQRDAAAMTIDGALAKNPENAATHANRGWALLHAGDPRQAMVHFREALRLKPDMDWAKAGIVEALKARNIVYRMMLKYFLFMGRLKGRAQWGIVVGAFVCYRFLLTYAKDNPEQGKWIWPVLIAYIAFAVLSWLAYPLSNLLLRIDRFGRYALSRDQTVASNWVGVCVLLALIAGAGILVTHDDRLIIVALMAGLMVLPVAATFNCKAGWPRNVMAGYTGLLGLVAVGNIMLMFLGPRLWSDALDEWHELSHTSFMVFLVGVFLTGWVANALMMVKVRR